MYSEPDSPVGLRCVRHELSGRVKEEVPVQFLLRVHTTDDGGIITLTWQLVWVAILASVIVLLSITEVSLLWLPTHLT